MLGNFTRKLVPARVSRFKGKEKMKPESPGRGVFFYELFLINSLNSFGILITKS